MKVAPWTPEEDERLVFEMIADPPHVLDRGWVAFDIEQSERRQLPVSGLQMEAPVAIRSRPKTATATRGFLAQPGHCHCCGRWIVGLSVLIDPQGNHRCPLCGGAGIPWAGGLA